MRTRNRSRTREFHCAASAVLAAALTLQSGADAAEPTTTAQADRSDDLIEDRMRAGILAYRKQDYETARRAFTEAWQVKQHGTIAASLAQVEMKLGQFRAAAEHWSYYLESLDPEPSRSRTDAESGLAECRKHLGRLVVNIEGRDATLFLDGHEVRDLRPRKKLWISRSSTHELWIEPGFHRVLARAGDRQSSVVGLSVELAQTRTVDLVLPAEKMGAPSFAPLPHLDDGAPSAATKEEKSGGVPARTIVLAGGATLTLASAVVGGIFSIQAGNKYDEMKELQNRVDHSDFADQELVKIDGTCRAPPEGLRADCTELGTVADSHTRFQNLAFYSYVAAGTFAVATVATYFLWPTQKRDKAKQATFTVVPWVDGGNRGAQLEVRF